MEKINNDKKGGFASYILYLITFFLLGILMSNNLNFNGISLQEIINFFKNLNITMIAGVVLGIQLLSIILIFVIGVAKNLDVEKGFRNILFIMTCMSTEIFMLLIYKLIWMLN